MNCIGLHQELEWEQAGRQVDSGDNGHVNAIVNMTKTLPNWYSVTPQINEKMNCTWNTAATGIAKVSKQSQTTNDGDDEAPLES